MIFKILRTDMKVCFDSPSQNALSTDRKESTRFVPFWCQSEYHVCPICQTFVTSGTVTGESGLGPKGVRLSWNGIKSGTFSDQISVHFGSPNHDVLKSNMKSPKFAPILGQYDSVWAQTWYTYRVKCQANIGTCQSQLASRQDKQSQHQSPQLWQ